MTYESPSLQSIGLDSASASCCTPLVNYQGTKIFLRGSCYLPIDDVRDTLCSLTC